MTTAHFLVFLSAVDWHQYCLLSRQLPPYIIRRCPYFGAHTIYMILPKLYVLWCSNVLYGGARTLYILVINALYCGARHSIFWWSTLCTVVLEQFYSETSQIWKKISGAPKVKFRLNLGVMECKCSSVCSARRFQATSCFDVLFLD